MDTPDERYFGELGRYWLWTSDIAKVSPDWFRGQFKHIWVWEPKKGWYDLGQSTATYFLCVARGGEKHVSKEKPSSDTGKDIKAPQLTGLPDEDIENLKAFITDQWRLIIHIPPPKRDWRELIMLKITGRYDTYSELYLLGVNRRSLAGNALTAADKFLKKNDLLNTKKYADISARHYIESNNLFKASEEVLIGSASITSKVLEGIYRATSEASKYGWFLMCGPKCYEVADYVFLMTDFSVDYGLKGEDEATKNLVVKAFVHTLLGMDGIKNGIENRTTHLVGKSGLYELMDKTIGSPEFQKVCMKWLAENAAYVSDGVTSRILSTIWKGYVLKASSAAQDFVKSSSDITPSQAQPIEPEGINPSRLEGEIDEATITRIVNGETLEVIYNNEKRQIRLIDIDTPETIVNEKTIHDSKEWEKG